VAKEAKLPLNQLGSYSDKMNIVRKVDAKEFKNSDVCTAFEYPLGDKDINGAVIKLDGRYPDTGRVTNKACKELVFVVRGSGKVVVEGQETELSEGDLAIILPGEKYYFEGKLEMFMPCTPAWYPEQHEEVG
jgi:mannose-6-phosphate isomerase-like protein (cupin superfamily)